MWTIENLKNNKINNKDTVLKLMLEIVLNLCIWVLIQIDAKLKYNTNNKVK